MSEASCILSGLGYAGKDPETSVHRFNRVENISIRDVEFASNPKMIIDRYSVFFPFTTRCCCIHQLLTHTVGTKTLPPG